PAADVEVGEGDFPSLCAKSERSEKSHECVRQTSMSRQKHEKPDAKHPRQLARCASRTPCFPLCFPRALVSLDHDLFSHAQRGAVRLVGLVSRSWSPTTFFTVSRGASFSSNRCCVRFSLS
ncbi:unnamed protein product, partial [Scytosiphon promiscuus]